MTPSPGWVHHETEHPRKAVPVAASGPASTPPDVGYPVGGARPSEARTGVLDLGGIMSALNLVIAVLVIILLVVLILAIA